MVLAIISIVIISGCTEGPWYGGPAATDPPVTTDFDECAGYYPVMESYPRQCRDGVSGEVFTEIICSEGDIMAAQCPDGTIYDVQNCVNGTWFTINYIRNPCETLGTSEVTPIESDMDRTSRRLTGSVYGIEGRAMPAPVDHWSENCSIGTYGVFDDDSFTCLPLRECTTDLDCEYLDINNLPPRKGNCIDGTCRAFCGSGFINEC